jgi:chitin disaccharide deacetylase
MTKYLIVNSDDFGISENVSRGIIEAHQKGIVTSTSTMVNMPAAASAIKAAHEQAPKLGLGLHLVLSYGRPVSAPEKVPSLVNEDGTFAQTYSELMAKLPVYTAADLETELRAQFDHFVELAGHKPDHIDSHHRGAYIHADAFEVMMSLCEEHGLPLRRPEWLDGDEYSHLPTNNDGKLVGKLRAIYEKHGKPAVPQYMTDGTFFWDRRDRLETLRAAIEAIQADYTELICHVGYGAGLEEDYHIQREDELAAVLHPEIVALVNANFQKITFAELPKA